MTAKTQTTVTSELPVRARSPFSIDICEPSAKAFQMASALVRQGYTIMQDRPVDVTPYGVANLTLILGNPTESGYADAEEAKRLGLELESAEFERRVEREVGIRVEQIKRDEHEARKAALLAEHKRKMVEIEKAAEAELHLLQQATQSQVANLK